MKEDFNDYYVREDRFINYFSYHYFLFSKKIIKFLYRYDEIILIITKLLMCVLLILNLKGCIDILFRKEFISVLQEGIKLSEIGFLFINLIFIFLFLVSCKSTYTFFYKGLYPENYNTDFIVGNSYFRVKRIIWYWQCFVAAAFLLFIIVKDEKEYNNNPFPEVPFFIFSTSWVIGAIYFLKSNISKYFKKLFLEFRMETTIQVDYLDFQNDKIIDKNPHVQEGQLLKIQVEPYPKNKENANLISILNTKTPNKEAVVFQFYDKFIAEQIRNDNNAIEVSVIKILPYFKLDLKLKRNFLFDDEKKIYE
jgi:hypothetical protein